jgi:hypothetical protein
MHTIYTPADPSLNKIVSSDIKKTTKETPKHRIVIFGGLQQKKS